MNRKALSLPSPSLPLAQEGTRTGRQQKDPPWLPPGCGSKSWLWHWTALHLPCATSHEITSSLSPALEPWPAHGGECCPAAVRKDGLAPPEEWRVGRGQSGTGHRLSDPHTGEKSRSSQRPWQGPGRALCSGSCCGEEGACGTQAPELGPTGRPSSSVSWAVQPGPGPLHLFSVVRAEADTTTGP